ncbi:DUF498-domain-containing protein, partial [Sistotremastrum suecicum HHB10207 ss-3]
MSNMLDDGKKLTIQVRNITPAGIELADGLVLPSACIFLGGEVFLWKVPDTLWTGWTKEHFQIFDVTIPKPEILILGTGKSVVLPPPSIRTHLSSIGIGLEVLDTWNACSTYNLLSEEGRRVAAALLP